MNRFVRANPAAMQEYRSLLNLTPDEERREAFYYVVNLLEYVNWYFLYSKLGQALEQLTLIESELDNSELVD